MEHGFYLGGGEALAEEDLDVRTHGFNRVGVRHLADVRGNQCVLHTYRPHVGGYLIG